MRAVAFRSAQGSALRRRIPRRRFRRPSGATSTGSPTSATTRCSRVAARLEPDPEAQPLDVPRSGEGPPMPFERIGWVRFAIDGSPCRLSVFWLNEYAGGIFIPFRDATSGQGDLWRRSLPVGLGQGRRPRDRRRGAGARLQLRLPPVVRVRPDLVVPAGAAGELAADPDPRRRAAARRRARTDDRRD